MFTGTVSMFRFAYRNGMFQTRMPDEKPAFSAGSSFHETFVIGLRDYFGYRPRKPTTRSSQSFRTD